MKRIAFIVGIIYCFTACNIEIVDGPEIPKDEATPQIELILPDAEMVHLYSTATPNENYIDSIWVIAFNGPTSTATKQWVEKIDTLIARNGYASQLLPQLAHEPNPKTQWEAGNWRFVCIANVNSVDTAGVVYPTDINARFRLDEQRFYEGKHLPMYGEFIWSASSGYTCVMKRAVAKVQVQMGTSVSDVTGNFDADNVTYRIYNALAEGTIQPPASGIGSGIGLQTPYNYYNLLQAGSATEQNTNVYLYEFESSRYIANGTSPGIPTPIPGLRPDTTFHVDRQHIILQKYNSIPNNTTYYRLDFYNPITKTFLDTERNHHYLFTINRVRSEGYQTFDEAQNNPGSNIEYTIRIDDGAIRSSSNGQYAIVTTNVLPRYLNSLDTLSLVGTAGSGNDHIVVMARIQVPTLQMATSWYTSTLNKIELEDTQYFEFSPLSNDFLQDPTFPPTPEPVSIRVKTGTPSGTIGVLTFHVGNITQKVYFRFEEA